VSDKFEIQPSLIFIYFSIKTTKIKFR